MNASSSRSSTRDFAAGARAIVPILLGIVPFGLLAGITSVEIGLHPLQASAFSLILFAGTAQLAAIDLLGAGAPLLVVVPTALVINVRFLMYSASLAPYLADEPASRRVIAAYLLTDQAYATTMVRLRDRGSSTVSPMRFYLGAAAIMWATWQLSTLAGAFFGAVTAANLPLKFAVPLAILSLLVPGVTDRVTLVAAIVGATVAVAAAELPLNLGMPLGAVVGVLAATLADRAGGP